MRASLKELHRLQRNLGLKPLKPVSMLAAQRELAGFGCDQAAVVEQSVAKGWQGLFELKAKTAATSSLGSAAWWLTESATMAKARELSMQAKPGESIDQFRGRVRQAMEKREAA